MEALRKYPGWHWQKVPSALGVLPAWHTLHAASPAASEYSPMPLAHFTHVSEDVAAMTALKVPASDRDGSQPVNSGVLGLANLRVPETRTLRKRNPKLLFPPASSDLPHVWSAAWYLSKPFA